jgi:hypothetical protein
LNALLVAILVAGCTFGGALVGMWLRRVLPDSHVDADSRDVIKLATGLIATMTALILGLVVSSAKSEFDAEDANVTQSAADVLELDRSLEHYGAETAPIRVDIKRAVAARLAEVWPETGGDAGSLENAGIERGLDDVIGRLLGLAPSTDAQKYFQSQALQLLATVQDNRWLMLERSTTTVAQPFLSVIVAWLTLIFASFGLFTPKHTTGVVTLAVCALSVAAAIFLILELDRPYQGLIRVSPAPVQFALAHLGA